MTRHAASVTGIGLCTPAGGTWGSSWEQVCQGTSTTALAREAGTAYLACRVNDSAFEHEGRAHGRRPNRCSRLALTATREALADAELVSGDWDPARVAIVVGASACGADTQEEQQRTLWESGDPEDLSPYGFPGALGNSVAAHLSMELGVTGPLLVVNTACASGATALCTAMDLLARGRCDIALAGGAEACLVPYYVAGFDRLRALSHRFHDPAGAPRPFDAAHDGFVMGEGAGMLVLERPDHARARRVRVRARLAGYGASSDAHHIVAPHPRGAGLATAVRDALADADAAVRDVGCVNAHGTGTPAGDTAEASALAALLPHEPLVTSTKAVTGHLLGAAGAVEAALTVLTVEQGRVPPTGNLTALAPGIQVDVPTTCRRRSVDLALSTSMGFGGHNVALAFTTP